MMKGATLFVVRIATAAALLSASHQAFAQANSPWRPERPNRALFGGGGGSTEQSLVVTPDGAEVLTRA